MTALWKKIKLGAWRWISDRMLFNVAVRERWCRQEFFYNAFRALKFNGIAGDYLEFGCWGGRTFALAYHEAQRHHHAARFWAFDSFQGLPAPKDEKDTHPVWVEGALSMSLDSFHATCVANGIPAQSYSVIPGFYEKSLATLALGDAPNNLALVYIDCDLYSSTMTVLEFLAPRMKHGMIIAFDDYYCWSASQISGERKAMLDFQLGDPRWEWLPYMRFGWHGNSFVLEDKTLAAA